MKKKDRILFAIAADNYKNEVLSLRKLASWKTYSRVIVKLIEHFGSMYIDQITKQHIQQYIVKVSQQRGIETMRQHLTAFRGIMEYADDNWEMPGRLKKPKKPRPRQQVYMFDEVRKLWRYLPKEERILSMCLAETGMRLGEALALKPEDVVDCTISITKNVYEGVLQDTPKTDSSVRVICISKILFDEMKTLMKPGKFIFRSPAGDRPMWPQSATYMFREACGKAGLSYKAFHAFRRGNITELILNVGVPERVVGMRVGHLSESVTLGVYCKAAEGTDRVWVDKIAEHLYLTKTENNGTLNQD